MRVGEGGRGEGNNTPLLTWSCGGFFQRGCRALPHHAVCQRHCRALGRLQLSPASLWSTSRKARNRLMHALHGNTVPGRPLQAGWRRVGRPGLNARELMEPLMASKLRQEGWRLPAAVPDTYMLRVYDTRLEMSWLRGLLAELGLGSEMSVVGGDFLSSPSLEDKVALQTGRLERWGPSGDGPYHLVVPPRPHLAVWMQRARQQMALEAPGTWVTLCAVVPRDACPQEWDLGALRRAMPQVECLLDDPSLEVRVVAVAERPPVLRVPAAVTELPPPQWERGLLPRNRVLLCVHVRRHAGTKPSATCSWVRGSLPPIPVEDIELLRLEYVLPPATKSAAGERALRAAVRTAAAAVGQPAPHPAQLRQVQVAHGVVYALLGVPRDAACSWLRGSGCGGLYIRPFWTSSSGAAVARSRFALLWVRGRLEAGPKLWEALQAVDGFYGLVADGKDLALRISASADRAVLQSQVQFVLGSEAKVRSSEPGLRWWRLGPLADAELWQVKDLIALTGLQLARADLRVARMGPFRSAVFFAASGEPTRTTLDDGSWASSEARLSPAQAPPRRPSSGQALAPQSAWGGPRPKVAADIAPMAQPSTAVPSSAAFPRTAQLPTPPVRIGGSPVPDLTAFPPLAVPTGVSLGSGGGAPRAGKRRGRGSAPSVAAAGSPAGGGFASAPSSSMAAQMAALVTQMGALTEEIRELRQQNVELRRQLDLARGIQQHQPYAVAPLPPLPTPAFSPVRPARTRAAGDLSPGMAIPPVMYDAAGEVVMSSDSPPVDADRKRGRRALDLGVPAVPSTEMPDAVPASAEAPIPHDV
jgi:hypothetical protein